MALNMADLFEHAADAFPARVALIYGERQVTYRELEDEANRLAHHLAAQGAGPGDHVGLYARNSVAAVATLLATVKLRAVAININYRYVQNELAYYLRDADLCALVYDQDLASVVDAVMPPDLPRVSIGGSYDEALSAASAARDFGPRSAGDIYIIYTGGIHFISGERLEDEWAQSRAGADGDGMVRMAPAPLIHGAAMVATLACLFVGDTAVILPKFDADAVWEAVQRHKINVLSVIGDAMARPLIESLAAGAYDTSSLISLNSTAALFSPAVKAGPDVIVIDEAGGVCGPGQTGKLARGGHIPLGYYKDPVKTAAMYTEVDGRRYAVPGDWARVEEDGTLTLLGRGNTCVNTGGEKVDPEEVEGALKSHPDVFDSLVIGVPDNRLGQRVAALVQLRPDVTPDRVALEAHVRGLLAGYKVPRTLWFVDHVGRTVSGKADYGWARQYVAEHPPATPPQAPAQAPAQAERAP